MPPNPRSTGILIAALVLVAACGATFALWREKTRFPTRASTTVQGRWLEMLGRLESGLNRGLTANELENFASEIQQEIARHPLPTGDEFQFGSELLVRDLRSLAAWGNRRDLRAGNKAATNDLRVAEAQCRSRILRNVALLRTAFSSEALGKAEDR